MKNYTRVKVKNDKYMQDWVKCWNTWFIIEVYNDGNYEVEFSNPETWIDYAQTVIKWEDLEEVSDNE